MSDNELIFKHFLINPRLLNVAFFIGQIRCEREESEGIMWNTTLAGTTKHEPCPANQKG